MAPQQIAAANRDDMPGTPAKPSARYASTSKARDQVGSSGIGRGAPNGPAAGRSTASAAIAATGRAAPREEPGEQVRIERVRARVHAGGDVDRAHACCRRALDVGPDPVADGEHRLLCERPPLEPRECSERHVVDGQIRLAGVGDLSADPRVGLCERAGAVDDAVAALDGEVRVGADHGEPHALKPASRAT